MRPRQSSFWRVFGIPLGIGLLSAAGLFAALLGDGPWDALSWVGDSCGHWELGVV